MSDASYVICTGLLSGAAVFCMFLWGLVREGEAKVALERDKVALARDTVKYGGKK